MNPDGRTALHPQSTPPPFEMTGEDKMRARSIGRLGLFLERAPAAVEANVAGALEEVLCRLPWDRALRRHRDRVVLQDVRHLFEQMEPDDVRRKRLKFLLEHAERRSRL